MKKMRLPSPKEGVVEVVGTRTTLRHAGLLAAAGGIFFAPGIHDTKAAFTTNFTGTAVTGGTYDKGNSTDGNYRVDYSCGMSYTVVSGINSNNCGGNNSDDDWSSHNDGTPFFQAMFTETGTNKKYFHVIIGDKNKKGLARNEMVFEYIIEATSNQMDSDGLASASYTNDSSQSNVTWNQFNPYNATDIRSATGSGNPTRAIMNQVLYNDDGTVNTQFLKGVQGGTVAFNKTTGQMTITGGSIVFDSKPIITQFANTPGEMYNQFTIDMRHKSYSDKTQMSEAEANGPNGKITNITNLIGGSGAAKPAADQGDYDTTDATFTAHYVNAAKPNYTAGAYTYTPSAGTGYNKLGSNGAYDYDIAATTYTETGFIATGKDYTGFCDPSMNPDWRSGTNALGGPLSCTNAGSTRRGKGDKGWD